MNAPPLPDPVNRVIRVRTVEELNTAIRRLKPNTTIALEPGRYELDEAVTVEQDNVTIRGVINDCNSVELVGPGMENPNRGAIDNGIWINAKNTTVANLTIGEVYFHTIQINNKAFAPHIYNVRMYNSGQQFVKANPADFGVGVDNGIVEYSVMEYTNGPPLADRNNSGTGYTNGVDVHAGANWRISNNRFSNFHTPDHVDHLWNAAVLAWTGARNTITENNVFIDVDRAIAYGLKPGIHDHKGGVIRNNMVVMTPNLYSETRTRGSDATIAVLDSPGTTVLHNTILTSDNTKLSIEFRYHTAGSEVANNITDAPISHRNGGVYTEKNNITDAQAKWFINPAVGNLRLRPEFPVGKDQVTAHRLAAYDIDRQQRPAGVKVDLGADEQISVDH